MRCGKGAMALLLLAVAACTGGVPETPAATAQSIPTVTSQPVPAGELSSALAPTPAVPTSAPSEDDPYGLMDAATIEDISVVRRMGESGYASYMPVLVDLLRFSWLLEEEMKTAIFSTLTKLSGESYKNLTRAQLEWDWWVEWLGRHPEIQPPPGYGFWKGKLFSTLVDPEMVHFFPLGVKTRIRLEEIVWGGVRKDGIPDLTNPPVLSAKEARFEPDDRVFGVSINGEHRAYPLRILNAHEMANDVLGGVPFALAY